MTIDPSRLTISLEEEDDRWRRRLSVTVPADVVETERKKAAEKLASRLDLPGFRKGKVPARIVEQKYGQTLRQETLDRVINEAYRHALQTEAVRPISEGELQDVDYRADEDLSFAISFDVQPEIELARLGGFTVERPSVEVDDEQVDRVLDRVRENNAVWQPEEGGTPDEGDLVRVRIERLDEDADDEEPREYEFVLGRDEAIPDVEEAITTLAVGESGEFTIAFPDDFPNEERRGEERRLRIGILGRKSQDLPEVDDEFARSVGDFEDVDALLGAIREDLAQEAAEQSERAVRGRLLDQLLEANPFQVPTSMVDSYVRQVVGDGEDVSPEELEEAGSRLRPQAERAVKRALVIDRIAETQGLRATEEELDARIQEIAERNDTQPAKVYAQLQKAERLGSLEREITENKVFDFLMETSTIVSED